LNFGLDFALFDYKLNGTIEYFNRLTSDLLLDPLVSEPGPAVRAWRNIDGEVVNSGLEVSLNALVLERDNLSLNIGANAAFLNNEFQNYEGQPDIVVGQLFGQGTSNAVSQVIRDGLPLNNFYTREVLGIDESGNSIYTDNGDVLYLFGDPNADLVLGLSAGLNISKLSFGVNFNGAFGHQLYNNTAMSVISIGNLGTRNIDANLLGGDVRESVANAITPSSRYLEDGDFIKLANATLGYAIGSVGSFSDIQVTLTGQNLFVITDYTGFDPEVNTVNLRNGVPSNGIEYIPYPSARSFILSVGFSF
jgi:iron complex outermembrane receptor protein